MSKLYQRTVGAGKSIVLVHGWGMHSGVWNNFAEQLAQYYRVTCLDLPGHGYSAACDDLSLATISAALADTVEEKSCWLGWSLGASVVLDLAARYPERVSSVILLAGNPRFVQTATGIDAWPGMHNDIFTAFSQSLQQDRVAALKQFLILQSIGLSGAKSQLLQLKQRLAGCEFPCLNILQSGLALLQHSDLRATLAALDIPVLAIMAEKDALVPAALGHYLLTCQPRLQLNLIENAGHAVFQSHADEVLEAVSRFMEQQ